jgi:hypothetical protein
LSDTTPAVGVATGALKISSAVGSGVDFRMTLSRFSPS